MKTNPPTSHQQDPDDATTRDGFNRRTLFIGGSLAAAGVLGAAAIGERARQRVPVFVAGGQSYEGPLTRTLRDGLRAIDLDAASLRGKRILLKPNLVEPSRQAPHMTTHPALVRAAVEVFRQWGADVTVGEGPGHVRDTDMALEESGLATALWEDRVSFGDLNYEEVAWRRNRGRTSKLPGFYLPRSVLEDDLIVSMPKMKTHHWMGVTAALKNMYGVIPGIKYGWPKNVLHHAGIPNTVFDINASLPPTIAIVDGIECMEGDGPIMGTAKSMGVLVIGRNLTAVDATVCRLMRVNPRGVPYLRMAEGRLGPLSEHGIEQRGEDWRPLAQPFAILDEPHLRQLRAAPGILVS